MAIKNEKEKAAKEFAKRWEGRGYERGECQSFWIDLLMNVLGVEQPTQIIQFEVPVKLSHTSFIDAYINSTKVLIEQKSIDKDLRAPIKQSDGTLLNPSQQAKRYGTELPYSMRPRWVVACNFKSFLIYDMEHPHDEPIEVLLADLAQDYHRLSFLVDEGNIHLKKEMEVSIKAGQLVGKIYEALLAGYIEPESPELLRNLNILCVRLVFCLYAEDANLFPGGHSAFYDYMRQYEPRQMRKALINLFEVLNTPVEERDPYLKDDDPLLAAFPYCAGGLFRAQNVQIPSFTDEIANLLLEEASSGFDWSDISPTIFGAVFESTLNPETRRSGGMHYTSVENIHKVIDPLFMNDLNAEFQDIKAEAQGKVRDRHLRTFQDKIASLRFLDPACGSGNFLTETYLSLRRLENKVIAELTRGQSLLGFEEINPIKVNINQFYGIEINDFAVTVAATALWIAEAQTMAETEKIINLPLEYFPLKYYDHIHEANALRLDWNEVCPASELNYIIGNPPFVGNNNMNPIQREDILPFFPHNKTMDYVCAWYVKAARLIQNTNIKCALVSTNSICQGELVPLLWKPLFEEYDIHIDFAYRTFRWNSESTQKASVHCVIVAFSQSKETRKKIIFSTLGVKEEVKNINAYLLGGTNVFVESRNKPMCDVPPIRKGNQPTDGGNLIIEGNQLEEFLEKEPLAKPYIKKLVGAKEYINNIPRYCLWLKGTSPNILRQMPLVLERIKRVREMRLASPDAATRKLADTPSVFRETNNPDTFIIVPSVSSENRRYIPLGFLNGDTIPTNLVLIIPNATIYHFGVLTSNVHMAWMRAVCGRLEMRYRYSKEIVYNCFPWPSPTDAQRKKIETTAQAILDARALYPESSLADLYDEVTMPPELRKAHQMNDKAVMEAYGFKVGKDFTESDCVARLMEMYSAKVMGN